MDTVASAEATALKHAADHAIAAGDTRTAARLLQRAAALAPGRADLWLALAACKRALGEPTAALGAVDLALAADPRSFHGRLMRGSLLDMMGDAEASAAYQAALDICPPPHSLDAATARTVARARQAILMARGRALSAGGRTGEAAEVFAQAAARSPQSGEAWHALADAQAVTHRFGESAAAAARAIANGHDAAETWTVLGRARQGLGDFDGAEAAFREALGRRPALAAAHADLAQLVWMRTADARLAVESLDGALASHPADPSLSLVKARLLESMGDKANGYAALADALARHGADPALHASAAALIIALDPEAARGHAESAVAQAPDSPAALAALCQAWLALGQPDRAAPIAEDLRRRWPDDQSHLALLGVIWRMTGDARHPQLNDYGRLVRRARLDTPKGWTTLEAYLTDLAASLGGMHRLAAHPIGRSVRHGAQTTQSLTRLDDPVIRAFFEAIDNPIRTYIAQVRATADVVGGRATGDYGFGNVWSTLLWPGGHHLDHVHPSGWISSACYIATPAAVERGREGWLCFGHPGLTTSPVLPAEHFEKPRAGDLILFPSYMWHATVPFGGDEPRLSIAFDLLPR